MLQFTRFYPCTPSKMRAQLLHLYQISSRFSVDRYPSSPRDGRFTQKTRDKSGNFNIWTWIKRRKILLKWKFCMALYVHILFSTSIQSLLLTHFDLLYDSVFSYFPTLNSFNFCLTVDNKYQINSLFSSFQ